MSAPRCLQLFRSWGRDISLIGSLEFCAGNSGLSWPDVLLGALPNVYVYACNNPSESIIAKRRGYGTIVSHNVPPYGRWAVTQPAKCDSEGILACSGRCPEDIFLAGQDCKVREFSTISALWGAITAHIPFCLRKKVMYLSR